MTEASKEDLKPTAAAKSEGAVGAAEAATGIPAAAAGAPSDALAKAGSTPATIGIDDFAKLDLRVGKVVACEFVEGSDKLLRFELDAGELGKRQIFSGIRASYGEPEKLDRKSTRLNSSH